MSCGPTPGVAIGERGLGVGRDGRIDADGDGEGETDRESQQPDLKVKDQQAGKG